MDDPERELTEEEKRAIKEAQEAMGSFFSTKKPKNASDGLAQGLGNAGKGVLGGLTAAVAMPYLGAKAEGGKGFAKGLGAGVVTGFGMIAAGVGTGVYQIGRGAANSKEAYEKQK